MAAIEVAGDDIIDQAVTTVPAGAARPPTPRRLRLPLASIEDVRRELARVYREVKAGALPSDEGTRRTFILVSLAKMIEAGEIERRLEALEAPERAATMERPDR